MKENPYFKIDEFKCKCGKCKLPQGVPSDELIDALCEVREHYGKPITINSGYRCPEHNAKIGGAPKSQHCAGSASDFTVKDIPTKEVYDWCEATFASRPYGLARRLSKDPFKGFVHLDTRGKKARWIYAGSYEPKN